MQINEAIILAGGLGTRLRSAVPDLPKCMAPVAGRPFLAYLIDYFTRKGIEKFIFSLGYKHEVIESFLESNYPTLPKEYAVEHEPLGTGGAIKLACGLASASDLLILNGDTYFGIDNVQLSNFHASNRADCSLALKPMQKFDRYGVVDLHADNMVKSFKEKQYYDQGLINGGVYALNRSSFLQQDLPTKFSFEKEYLESAKHRLFGLVQDDYFIDIGIPADYDRAQTELVDAVNERK